MFVVALYCIQCGTIGCAYARLAATELRLASVWVGAFEDEAVRDAIQADKQLLPAAILPIGYAGEKPEATTRRSLQDLMHYLVQRRVEVIMKFSIGEDVARDLQRVGLEPGEQVVVQRTPDGIAPHRAVNDAQRVQLEVTTGCNLGCITCIHNVWDAPQAR